MVAFCESLSCLYGYRQIRSCAKSPVQGRTLFVYLYGGIPGWVGLRSWLNAKIVVQQNLNHEWSPISVLTGPDVENYMYADRDQRVTIMPNHHHGWHLYASVFFLCDQPDHFPSCTSICLFVASQLVSNCVCPCVWVCLCVCLCVCLSVPTLQVTIKERSSPNFTPG